MDSLGLHKRRVDRLSSLPNEIISHIVSFVSAKEAAFVSVLSKRFRNLYTIIPILEFNKNQGRSLAHFLDGVLALPASSRIRKFSLKGYKTVKPAHYTHFNRCLCDVLKRGVLELELDMYLSKRYSLPFEVFTCKTLVQLTLGSDFVIDVLPENSFLPVLETLILNSVWFKDLHGCAFEKLLCACSNLKELTIGMDWYRRKWSGNIRSATLQRLTILPGDPYWCRFMRITLDTPSLTYLDLYDVVPDEYPIVNLDSLVEAELSLMMTVDRDYQCFIKDYENITSNPTNLIKALGNVEIMNLSCHDSFQAFYYFREAIPVFNKLYHLTLTPCDEGSCWKCLPFLLNKSPKLETLVIDGPLHYDLEQPESVCECMSEYSFLLSCPIEVLQINEYNGTKGAVEQLKHFIEKLSRLNLVTLRSDARPYDRQKTLMLPRVSSKCKIQVEYNRTTNSRMKKLDVLPLRNPELYGLIVEMFDLYDELLSCNVRLLSSNVFYKKCATQGHT